MLGISSISVSSNKSYKFAYKLSITLVLYFSSK